MTDENNEKQVSKLDLAEKSFNTVLEADLHLDNKASRILGAIAFLTLAITTFFVNTYISNEGSKQIYIMFEYYIEKNILSAFAFFCYILFIIIGAGLYLYALGPSLNIPNWFQEITPKKNTNQQTSDGNKNISLLFYNKVGSMEADNWRNYWENTDFDEIQSKVESNYIIETHLIAQKSITKFNLMSWGSAFFRIALIFLVFLVVILLSPNYMPISVFGLNLIPISLVGFSFMILFATYGYASNKVSPKYPFAVIWKVLAFVGGIVTIVSVVNPPTDLN